MFKHIPSHWLEIAGGYEYRNRAASGSIPSLYLDSSNTGKAIAATIVNLWDRGGNRSRLGAEGFLAREALLSDLDYSGGVIQLDTRWSPGPDSRSSLLWSVTAGTASGQLPVDDYFVLGVQTYPRFLLRAHHVTHEGVSGASPMGSAFWLSNTTWERDLVKIPTFNAVNLPYVTVKGEIFLDVAKVFDRSDVFQEKVFVDAGVGLQLATPTHALHLIFGQSATDGSRVFTLYVEKSW
jgi:hypothetical protein